MNQNSEFKILKQQDLYKILPFGKTKISQMLRDGILPTVQIGRDYITTEEKIKQWINDNIGEKFDI